MREKCPPFLQFLKEMQQAQPVRVAVVGAGGFVQNAYVPALQRLAAGRELEVAVVYSRSQASSQAVLDQVQG